MSLDSATSQVIENEAAFRLAIFFGVFLVMATWEIVAPRRKLTRSKSHRWFNNIAITVLNSLVVRLLFPAAAVGMALYVEEQQWGLFSLIDFPHIVEVGLAVLLLDLGIYAQHVMVHYVPLFWRFHRMHHADPDIDLTTGARFHPVEIVFSMGLKFIFIALLGAPVLAVFIFEAVLNGAAMFNHSNVKIPVKLDRILRWVIVTPDMHRVHHSVIRRETNSNFGFNFPWWDRIFATYTDQPERGHIGMSIGLDDIRNEKDCINILGLLNIPFKRF